MQKVYVLLFAFVLISIFIYCNRKLAQEQTSNNKGVNYYATEKYQNDHQVFWNDSADFALVTKFLETKPGSPVGTNYFFIYSTQTDTIQYEDKVIPGTVSWMDNNKIKIEQIPGRIKGKGHSGKKGYVYDVRTQKKSRFLDRKNNPK